MLFHVTYVSLSSSLASVLNFKISQNTSTCEKSVYYSGIKKTISNHYISQFGTLFNGNSLMYRIRLGYE